MPSNEHELLATLAVADKPIPWAKLASAVNWEGNPPRALIDYGLLVELDEGMWLHEALRERLLRDVGDRQEERRKRLG